VRQQVVRDLAGFHGELSRTALLEIAQKEPNPEIRSAANSALGAYVAPEIETVLKQNLRSSSFNNVLASAAIEAMRAQDDEKYVPLLLDLLKEGPEGFAVSGYGRALDALGFLSRHQDNKTPTREFLLGLIGHKREAIKVAAIQALGTLGDNKALATLQSLARSPNQVPERAAAERAVNALRNQEKPANELGALRQELQELRKNLDALRKEQDDLKAKAQSSPTNTISKLPPAPSKTPDRRSTNRTEVVKSPKAASVR
jgi:HEAT repeat protein